MALLVTEALRLGVVVLEAVVVTLALRLAVTEPDGVIDGVSVTLALRDAVTLAVPLTDDETDAVTDAESDALADSLLDADAVGEALSLADDVTLSVGDGVIDAVTLPVCDGLPVCETEAVSLGVSELDGVTDSDGVGVDDGSTLAAATPKLSMVKFDSTPPVSVDNTSAITPPTNADVSCRIAVSALTATSYVAYVSVATTVTPPDDCSTRARRTRTASSACTLSVTLSGATGRDATIASKITADTAGSLSDSAVTPIM